MTFGPLGSLLPFQKGPLNPPKTEGIVKKHKESPFVVHSEERHGERAKLEDYEMKITGMYGGDATKRQVAEAIKIQHTQGSTLINRQDEWRQVRLPRIQMCL